MTARAREFFPDGCVGTPLEGVRVEVRPERGGEDGAGRLCVRRRAVALGYVPDGGPTWERRFVTSDLGASMPKDGSACSPRRPDDQRRPGSILTAALGPHLHPHSLERRADAAVGENSLARAVIGDPAALARAVERPDGLAEAFFERAATGRPEAARRPTRTDADP